MDEQFEPERFKKVYNRRLSFWDPWSLWLKNSKKSIPNYTQKPRAL